MMILQDKVGKQIPGTSLSSLPAVSHVFSLAEPSQKPEARKHTDGIHAGQPLGPERRVERVESWSAEAKGGDQGNNVNLKFMDQLLSYNFAFCSISEQY